MSAAALEQELGGRAEPTAEQGAYRGSFAPNGAGAAQVDARELDVPIYAVDAVVRRSEALQLTTVAQRAKARQ